MASVKKCSCCVFQTVISLEQEAGGRVILRYISENYTVMEVVGSWGKHADLFRRPD
jgi:hypothetical protein